MRKPVSLVSRGRVGTQSLCLAGPHRISVWSLSHFPPLFHPFGKQLRGLGMNGGDLTWTAYKAERGENVALTRSALTFMVRPKAF